MHFPALQMKSDRRWRLRSATRNLRRRLVSKVGVAPPHSIRRLGIFDLAAVNDELTSVGPTHDLNFLFASCGKIGMVFGSLPPQ
jgi:hypothetical protein